MKIILTEEQFKEFLRHTYMNETAKIRPWTDSDYKRVNPSQVKDVDFAALKRADDEYNKENGLSKKQSVRTGSAKYGNPDTIPQKNIDKLQSDITKIIQQRYKDATGRDNAVIPYDELGGVGGEKASEILKKNGLLLSVSGKAFSYGNTKLPENTMIVNLTSAWNCPSIAAGECRYGKDCYARGGEKRFKDLQFRNLRMQNAYKYMTVKEILQLVEIYIESAPARIKYIRISEDGDFPDQETVNFCDMLAGHLKAKYGIVTTAYTARNLDYSGVKNMIINASNYRIKNPTRYFRAILKEDWEKVPDGLTLEPYDISLPNELFNTNNGTFKCHCDCRQCSFCYKTKSENGEPEGGTVSVAEIFRVK